MNFRLSVRTPYTLCRPFLIGFPQKGFSSSFGFNFFRYLMTTIEEAEAALNVAFLVIMSIIIFAMQGGFAFLEAGSVRTKNTTNILVKNTLDVAWGTLVYWSTGYAFGFGGDAVTGNRFIGYTKFFLTETDAAEYPTFFFQYVFCITAATIVSGAVAERAKLVAYTFYTITMTGFTYPVVTHWVWSPTGWLKYIGYTDYAGSSVVHCVGGAAAFWGATIVGARIGRFAKDGRVNPIPGHSTVLISLGYFLLFFGFFAFNGGSETGIAGEAFIPDRVGRAVIATALSCAGAFISTLMWYRIGFAMVDRKIFGKKIKLPTVLGGFWSISGAVNGGLGGMVAICASCFGVEPWAAFVIGNIAGVTYVMWSNFILLLRIDDPVNATAVHLACGWWGTLAAGLFINADRIPELPNGGVLYAWDSDSFIHFGIQAIGCATIIAWSSLMSIVIFGTLRVTGNLRVAKEHEGEGLDYHNGEPAYPLDPAILGMDIELENL